MKKFASHPLGLIALILAFVLTLMGIYAPLFASSKPLLVYFDHQLYFPLFRHLFYQGFYHKPIDLFYNLAMFSLPLLLALVWVFKNHRRLVSITVAVLHIALFLFLLKYPLRDPATYPHSSQSSFEEQVQQMPVYAVLHLAIEDWRLQKLHQKMAPYAVAYAARAKTKWQDRYQRAQSWISLNEEQKRQILELPTQYQKLLNREKEEIQRLQFALQKDGTQLKAQKRLKDLQDRREWLEEQSKKMHLLIMPLLRWHHWEEDAGGGQDLNQILPWWELTRINHRDLVAALIFGIRISLMVGVIAVFLSLIIALPIGVLSGYFAGKWDLIASRLMEIWESMPTFFMLLLIVAVMASKSVFLVIGLLALFSWTALARLLRAEVLKQRHLPYVEAARALGLSHFRILFGEVLPNALPPILTLIPFAMLGAITAEAGLSFLGLGEEGSCSLGVLMDEGRSAFPGESYLLWPPALVLTSLLVCIAIIGDTIRDVIDPKLS